jgi:hypothetical protein
MTGSGTYLYSPSFPVFIQVDQEHVEVFEVEGDCQIQRMYPPISFDLGKSYKRVFDTSGHGIELRIESRRLCPAPRCGALARHS